MSQKIRVFQGALAKGKLPPMFCEENYQAVEHFHQSLKSYAPTPLVMLPALARQLGVKTIAVKDESERFGLRAFKGLGASYAVHQIMKQAGENKPVLVTTTDGNHGKGVAWAAREAGCRAEVYMPKGTVDSRVQAIEALGNVTVTVTDMNYDDTVRWTAAYAQDKGYVLVQDTAFNGYTEVPQNIVLGYTTMIREALDQLKAQGQPLPTHVFLQAGVGSMAGGVLGYLADTLKDQLPVVSIIEAEESACILESCQKGQLSAIGGHPQTIMAGLNCGEVNTEVFPVLRDYAAFYFACPDEITEQGMRRLADPLSGDPAVVSGESGAVGLGLVMQLCSDPQMMDLRGQLKLDENSVILLFNTEGATDPQGYLRITGKSWQDVAPRR